MLYEHKRYILFATVLCIVVGIFLRFYNLNWGAPFYFHPDERNILYGLGQLRFPNQMNPHFFAYGSLPIYITYVTDVFIQSILITFGQIDTSTLFTIPFEMGLLTLRVFSSILSVITLFIIYKIITRLTTDTRAHGMCLFLSSMSVGFIQYAHFGTFEMWLTMTSTLLCYYLIRFIQDKNFPDYLIASFVAGVLIAIKISSLVFLSVFPFVFLLLFFRLSKKSNKLLYILHSFGYILLTLAICGVMYITSSPFSYFSYDELRSSLSYESAVALGTLPVFYTGSFFNTIPIIHQLIYVFPFIMSPLLALLLIPSCMYSFYLMYKKRVAEMSLILFFFFAILLSQGVLFVKWTRYMIPLLPFVYIMLAFFITYLISNTPLRRFKTITLSIIAFLVILHTFSFAKTVLFAQDTRVAATETALRLIPQTALITSEVYDLGIITFNPHFPHITLFNFYDLDHVPTKKDELQMQLAQTDYLILPSQRLIGTRLQKKNIFPQSSVFYNDLASGKLGFEKIYETPCDIFCKIVYMGNPVFHVEESINVFDRPTVFIYKKITQ